MDEGVRFGLLTSVAFLLLFVIEVVRAYRVGKNLGREQYANAATWGIFLVLSVAGHVHRPEDPSILITAGAGMQLLAFFLFFLAPRRHEVKENAPRASTDFIMLMIAGLSVRVLVTLNFMGYLPVDRTGDGCIQIIEFLTLSIGWHGLLRDPNSTLGFSFSKIELHNVRRCCSLFLGCVVFAFLCCGDLDMNTVADEGYALAIYLELAAWCCMFKFAWDKTKREGINAMALLPSAVQAMCRSYFWYCAFDEARVREPRFLQKYFNYVLFLSQLSMALLCAAMSSFCIHEFNPQLPHVVFMEVYSAEPLPV